MNEVNEVDEVDELDEMDEMDEVDKIDELNRCMKWVNKYMLKWIATSAIIAEVIYYKKKHWW